MNENFLRQNIINSKNRERITEEEETYYEENISNYPG
jgi:hypothetical protein